MHFRAKLLMTSLLCTALGVSSCKGGDGDGDGSTAFDATPEGYCDANTPCADVAKPFCDEEGVYPDSIGEPNTCIVEPQIECSETIECPEEATPHCTTTGECVVCLNFSHCNTTNPVCSFSTHTCGSCRIGDAGDSVCEAIDPFQPFCSEAGSCVECLENSACGIVTAPICDTAEFRCRGCESTGECDAGTCNKVSGVCEL